MIHVRPVIILEPVNNLKLNFGTSGFVEPVNSLALGKDCSNFLNFTLIKFWLSAKELNQ